MIEPAVSSAEDWAAFEALPRAVRRVLANAHDPYQAASVLAQWRSVEAMGWSADQYAAWLARADQRQR